MRFKFFIIFMLLFSWCYDADAQKAVPKRDLSFKTFSAVAVQQGGRLKPLDTLARETVQVVTGRSSFEGLPAIDIIFSWMFYPNHWQDVEVVEIRSLKIKEKLKFSPKKRYFSPNQLKDLKAIEPYFQIIDQKNNREEKLTAFERDLSRLFTQLTLLRRVSRGDFLAIIPHPKGPKENWFSIADLEPSQRMAALYSDVESKSKIEELKVTLQGIAKSFGDNDKTYFALTTTKFKQLLSELPTVKGYPFNKRLSVEVFYNAFKPFRKAWIFYLLAFVLLGLRGLSQGRNASGVTSRFLYVSGVSSVVIAFGIHIFGFVLRCLVTGRPPVGTMYESVVWVSLGTVFFAFLLFYSYKKVGVLIASCVVGAVGLILSDNLPLVLDPTIRPLAPVLRSNFWLTIHVLTITLSYSAFALAMSTSNWALVKFLRGHSSREVNPWTQYSYRAIQIGVLLLAAGTILGGVWADYSWGRFWGWDPKEVWALIALLFYLAVIHAKFMGWLKDFGLAAASVLAFQGILMAWYGVNFVLGAGLHSYGFGSGGLIYVLMYVVLQILFIGAAWLRFNGVRRITK